VTESSIAVADAPMARFHSPHTMPTNSMAKMQVVNIPHTLAIV
jgi:hypothetical protein